MTLDIYQIMKMLPHRYPFLMCDRILDAEYKAYVKGIKNVTINEPYFQGHFPGEPILPGVMILECMAQIGGFLFYREGDPENTLKGKIVRISDAKFLKAVIPGDVLEVEGRLEEEGGGFAQASLVARVGKAAAAKAVITYAFDRDTVGEGI